MPWLHRNTSTEGIERSFLSCQEETEQALRDGAVDKAVAAVGRDVREGPAWPVRPVSAYAPSAAEKKSMSGVSPVLSRHVRSVEQK